MKNNKILCVLPKHAYGDKKRDLTAEYSLFYLTLKKMLIKNNISFFDVYKKNKTILENNNLLLKKIYKFKPNIIFFSITQYEIYIDTLKIIKNNLDCKIINWYSDDTWRFSQQSIFYSKYFDLNITTSRDAYIKYKNNNRKVFLSHWSCPDNWIGNSKIINKKKEIIFIGSSYMGRKKIINKLINRGYDVKCYGYGWDNSSVINNKLLPNKIRNSFIALNFSKSRGNIKQLKARVFEILGIGGFCLTEYSHELNFFFSTQKHLDDFKNFNELENKINFYYSHPEIRNQIAKEGNKLFKKKYLCKFVLKKILNKVKFKKKRLKKIIKKTYVPSLNIHEKLYFIKIYKILSLYFLNIFFDFNKSLKISRRILFEIEFRLRGEKTYTSKGWCSNIFNYS